MCVVRIFKVILVSKYQQGQMSAERLPSESRQNLKIKNSMCCSLPRMPPRVSRDVGIVHLDGW